MNKWYKIENKSPEKAEIWIYEQIGEDFWSGGGVTAKAFQKDLSAIKASQIDLHINSPGGEVFDGLTIYNLIKQHPANVTTYIDGLAASIASVIALAGDSVVMAENALYMIHNPLGMAIGNSEDMRKMADTLDKVQGSIAIAYSSKTGKEEGEITPLMDAETWMTAQEALDFGFIDSIAEEMDMAACAKFAPVMQKAKFRNIPEQFNKKKSLPTARELERIIRDSGFTQKQAKQIMSEGYREEQRDVEIPSEPQRDVEEEERKPIDRTNALLMVNINTLTHYEVTKR